VSIGNWVSILTGLERPVQPSPGFDPWSDRVVSILTGLERPVQRRETPAEQRPDRWFQSSPALKDRCNIVLDADGVPVCVRFNPHRP